MDDLISRQAALKICRKYWHPTFNPIMEEIEKLPSAQPVGCNGCRYDWLGDPRCAKCARAFQDHYEAERKES